MSILDVPHTVYTAIRALLERADYHQAFHRDNDGEVIDMHGIALRAQQDPVRTGTEITIGTLISSRTKRGLIEFVLNSELTRMDLDKAREVVSMLQNAIEAAISDELIYAFLTTKVGLDDAEAGQALLDFRELRQGSRETVHPQ